MIFKLKLIALINILVNSAIRVNNITMPTTRYFTDELPISVFYTINAEFF